MNRRCGGIILMLTCVLIFSCNPKPAGTELDAESYIRYLSEGSEVSAQTQAVLLANVSGAMKQGGSVYAVEFCNLKASGITDSLNARWNCIIQRVSDQNRNPENNLETETDRKMWDHFVALHHDGAIHDTVVTEKGHAVYYKPILTAMPACLQCHGHEQEIAPETLKKIHELYPKDPATGYALNDLRGLWKITFK
jgi:hypothetical protein